MKKSARAARQNARATARTDHPGALAVRQADSVAFGDAAWRSTLPRNPNASHTRRALVDIAQQPAQDERAAQRSRSIYEEAAEHSNRGASLEALERHDEAEAAYRRAIALNPGLAVAHHNLGNLLHKQGHNAEAEAAFRVALTLLVSALPRVTVSLPEPPVTVSTLVTVTELVKLPRVRLSLPAPRSMEPVAMAAPRLTVSMEPLRWQCQG
jgi:tetratricopeptide (TPR) repeat protein